MVDHLKAMDVGPLTEQRIQRHCKADAFSSPKFPFNCFICPVVSRLSEHVNVCMLLQNMEINTLISTLAVFLADISLPNELIEESARPYMEEGGWATYPGDLLARPGPCNIQIRDSRLTQKEFMAEISQIVAFFDRKNFARSLKSIYSDWGT